MKQPILNSIEQASKVIGKTWPLYTFVASNPLSGYENYSFEDAATSAKKHLNTNVFPSAKLYREAWQKGNIDKTILTALLKENSLDQTPEEYLQLLESQKENLVINNNHALDRIVAKWLSAFMDEGLAEWDMPFKTEGFFEAWRHLVIYDSETGKTSLKEIPKTSFLTLESLLKKYSETDYLQIFTYHLAALPGWLGYINHRTTSNSYWQQEYPISITDYLAVRLWTANKLQIPFMPKNDIQTTNNLLSKIQYIWLKAWEESWQKNLVKNLKKETIKTSSSTENNRPDAQMVFCIDTRSELIRRHIENKGNYETYGYAGFFGIAMDYKSKQDGITRKSCPPIVASAYSVQETAQLDKKKPFVAFQKKNDQLNFGNYFLKRMKNMLPSAFGYVEGSGFFYGLSLIAKSILPGVMYRKNLQKQSGIESLCEPNIYKNEQTDVLSEDITLAEKVAIVKSAFTLMGWQQFSRLVIFVGHGSNSANNAFGSSLDCGACAASPGRHNARMLAKLANLPEVQQALANTHNINIPKDTVFVGAEHNTTTDAIILFDSQIPVSHSLAIKNVAFNFVKAQQTATKERLENTKNSVAKAQRKANNWSETRPEWGLAKNAGFIVGPRNLSKKINLQSRCFLHSYNYKLDPSGTALETIMQGPMVVTQWINNHYYFSTVDNNTFGGGTKITHNITGKFGVVQGNGGDLKMGLPLQSLFNSDEVAYHQPLRLTVIIEAHISTVSEILLRNENLKTLLDNEWIYLMVIDPRENNEIFKYKKSIQWESTSKKKEPKTDSKKTKALQFI